MMILMAVGGLLSLVCTIIILVHAFKTSVGQGFLSLCVPFYILYYMFAKFQHSQKALIIAGYFVGFVLSGVGQAFAMQQMQQQMQQQLQEMQKAPADAPN